jgi:Golgi to ER traffic protein 4
VLLLSEAPFRVSNNFCNLFYLRSFINSYLQNGNILAARTFITHFTSTLPKDMQFSSVPVGSSDEIILTKDAVVNFTQIALLTCQRAQGDKSKAMRESWIRLCGTYQSRGGILASLEVRKVNVYAVALYSLYLIVFHRHSTNWPPCTSKSLFLGINRQIRSVRCCLRCLVALYSLKPRGSYNRLQGWINVARTG